MVSTCVLRLSDMAVLMSSISSKRPAAVCRSRVEDPDTLRPLPTMKVMRICSSTSRTFGHFYARAFNLTYL